MNSQSQGWNPNIKVMDELIRSLSTFPYPGRPSVPINVGSDLFPKFVQYSPVEIIDHVKRGTPMGQDYYDHFLELRKLYLRSK